MKNKILLGLLCILLASCLLPSFAAEKDDEAFDFPPIELTVGDKTYPLYVIWLDLTDPLLKIDLALAEDKIGPVEDLIDLAQSDDSDEQIVAAINASYFNMKPDSQPASTLILDGAIEHIAEGGSIVGFDGAGQMHSAVMDIAISGSINNQWEPPYNWISWNINHLFYNRDAIMIFDNHYTGEFPEAPVYAIVIDKHRVVDKCDYVPPIPQNGYIIVQHDPQFLNLFNLGDRVDFTTHMLKRGGQGVASPSATVFQNIENAAGAGPILVKDGQKVLDAKAEGFQLAKFNDGAARRSMIGVNRDGALAMLVSDAPITLNELADIALQLDLVEAINLDGGGSSGLVYDGHYVVEPERKVSNAFVVKRLKEQPIRLVLNGYEEYFDNYPFVYLAEDGQPHTMVPLRGILEKIDATVDWQAAENGIVVKRFGSEIVFKVDQSDVMVDGKHYEMDVPLLIHKGRSYVSVRFLTEFFGGTVNWDDDKKLVDLTLPTVEGNYAAAEKSFTAKHYAIALDQYQAVLAMFPDHVSALQKSAYIHDVVLDDQRTALVYYRHILDIFPKDSATYAKLGTAYYKLDVVDQAIAAYKQSNRLSDNAAAHRGLYDIYKTSAPDKALVHAQWLFDNAKDVKQRQAAEELLQALKR